MGIKKDMYLQQIHKNKFVTSLKLVPMMGINKDMYLHQIHKNKFVTRYI
jgi:hypothetical protein